ncbi:hypothetical protein RAS1_23130 [Phycisphaerae bacterium RAS1]|nr:hypothetical protein RAS1_23130 [Phycisphaerae bacterium RAS1]
MQDLGTLGGPNSTPQGVSADGAVIVGTAQIAVSQYRAFRWTAAGGMQNLGTLGGSYSGASGVSADGAVIVGSARDEDGFTQAFRWTVVGGMQNLLLGGAANGVSANGAVLTGSGGQYALRWTAADGWQYLGTLGGGLAVATGISADGAVIVGYSNNAANQRRAFRWTVGDGMQDLGALGGLSSRASAVSADGAVIVGTANNAAGLDHAFRWTVMGGMQDLGTLGGPLSGADAVSADGAVAVGYAYTSRDLLVHAFRWNAADGMEDLGTLGGSQSEANAVSADGAVIVGRANNAAGLDHAFRWTVMGGMQDLGTLGGLSSEASGVSADGAVIVGYADNAANQLRAFRWTVPDPDSDGDGLPDSWETEGCGIPLPTGGRLSLFDMGARPDRRDIFVEIDSMFGYAPHESAMQLVVDAFAAAPNSGIVLHLIDGGDPGLDPVPLPANAQLAFNLTSSYFGSEAERNSTDPEVIAKLAAKRLFMRHCVFVSAYCNEQGECPAGLAAGMPSNEFFVALGPFGAHASAFEYQAGTFIHELGHTLGLSHGGRVDDWSTRFNYKPNYYSVMNYLWIWPHVWNVGGWRLDYSREAWSDLDELSLAEHDGLRVPTGASVPQGTCVPFSNGNTTTGCAHAAPGWWADWNGDHLLTENPVSADINFPGAPGGAPGYDLLRGHDDWSNLVFNFRSSPYYLTGLLGGSRGTNDVGTCITPEIAAFLSVLTFPNNSLGDLNCDGAADVLDINAFVLALIDPAGYAAMFPDCNILNGDIDGDGQTTVLDINPFVDLLLGG